MNQDNQESQTVEAAPEVGLRAFLRRRGYIIVVAALFGSAGMYYAQVFFPELPTYKAMIAGMGFGVFCTIVALGRHFV